MWLLGAVLPALVLALGLLIAGQVFRAGLLSSLDRGLLAQGAAEAVSLFDGPHGPHLHMTDSPLLETVRPFAPTAQLFDGAGQLVAFFPPTAHPPEVHAPVSVGPVPTLRTEQGEGGRLRVLLVSVAAPAGERFSLRLAASMGQIDASVRGFYQVSLSLVFATALLLVGVQVWFARRLSARLARLSEHLARVRQGQLDSVPAADAERDEISELRGVLAETTVQLKGARLSQDRLLAEAAHELRTPLTLMRTSLDLALRRERSVPELQAALVDTRTEVDRLARLATNLLDLGAAGRSWDLAVADLSLVLDEAAEAARAEAEARGLWLEVLGVRPAIARFSALAVRQAVDNLVSNALRFAPRGTAIRLATRRTAQAWELTVTDEGPGIPPEQREAVFAPFHRLDANGGSGLGLAIVSEVLRLHGGRAFAATPASGRGLEVVLHFPSRE